VNVKHCGIDDDGIDSVIVKVNELSSLSRCIKSIPGTVIIDFSFNPMNDDCNMTIKYKDITVFIDTPFSDYIFNCASPGETFDEFVSKLSNYEMKWWEHFF